MKVCRLEDDRALVDGAVYQYSANQQRVVEVAGQQQELVHSLSYSTSLFICCGQEEDEMDSRLDRLEQQLGEQQQILARQQQQLAEEQV